MKFGTILSQAHVRMFLRVVKIERPDPKIQRCWLSTIFTVFTSAYIYIYICIYTVEHGQLEYDPYELMALDWVPDKSIQSEILPGENAVRI